MALITLSPLKHLLSYFSLAMAAIFQAMTSQRSSAVASTNTLVLHSTLTSGTLTIGYMYEIVTNSGGLDMTNVGAADNNVGTQFAATGATPTSWGTGSLASAKETWDGFIITISGTSTINTISRKFLTIGTTLKIIASGAFTIAHENGSSGDDRQISLYGSVDRTFASGDEFYLEYRSDGDWHECFLTEYENYENTKNYGDSDDEITTAGATYVDCPNTIEDGFFVEGISIENTGAGTLETPFTVNIRDKNNANDVIVNAAVLTGLVVGGRQMLTLQNVDTIYDINDTITLELNRGEAGTIQGDLTIIIAVRKLNQV